MKCLAFSPASAYAGKKRIRSARFEERSMLPVSAACVVANGVREKLGQLYGTPLNVRLFEPVIPSPHGWAAISDGASLFRIRGSAFDTMIVLRPSDAAALVDVAFGEAAKGARSLSTIERSVLDRTVQAIATMCAPILGTANAVPAIEPAYTLAGFVTYVELEIDRPSRARIGIALSRDPEAGAQPQLLPESLLDASVEVAIRSEPSFAGISALAALEPGAIVPITKNKVLRATVLVAGTPVAAGECGVRKGRFAIAIDLLSHG